MGSSLTLFIFFAEDVASVPSDEVQTFAAQSMAIGQFIALLITVPLGRAIDMAPHIWSIVFPLQVLHICCYLLFGLTPLLPNTFKSVAAGALSVAVALVVQAFFLTIVPIYVHLAPSSSRVARDMAIFQPLQVKLSDVLWRSAVFSSLWRGSSSAAPATRVK
uniref:Uncharacterized protein n=1 Tax=Haptolina brevifila TaxID=156173 RepID=A0A7S2GDV1_9EUKA|mmetsp:Transcript_3496/g.7558  ORF Transcript_3496/g.7558 Transcript_3496/m.7558 type:complete len:162 (+) Transcript_3496:1007-1492(+)